MNLTHLECIELSKFRWGDLAIKFNKHTITSPVRTLAASFSLVALQDITNMSNINLEQNLIH